ncbi:helix-turn-helix domain-containing protein [Paraburkholderia azotifigens]|uniref:helix-turn-helix domain-containing protein n=1 Tax=Paraburkholderia azotifigens TaxID=2057004 RepID=UPI0038BC928B
MEKALTLKDVAELLSVSYNTVYSRKEELGFFQVGSVWRVWPDVLQQKLAEPRKKRERAADGKWKPPSYSVDDVLKGLEGEVPGKKFLELMAAKEAQREAIRKRRKS